MIVKIENQANEPYGIEVNGKKKVMLDGKMLKANKSACTTGNFPDLAEALNFVFGRAYTRRFELDLYPYADYEAKITILDGNLWK